MDGCTTVALSKNTQSISSAAKAKGRDEGAVDAVDMNILIVKKCLERSVVEVSLNRGIKVQGAVDPFGTCPLLRGVVDDWFGRLGPLCSSTSRQIIVESKMEAEHGMDYAYCSSSPTCCKIDIVRAEAALVGSHCRQKLLF